MAQLGAVWLPGTHVLGLPLICGDLVTSAIGVIALVTIGLVFSILIINRMNVSNIGKAGLGIVAFSIVVVTALLFQSRAFYTQGIGLSLISMVSYVGLGWFMYLTVLELTNNRSAGVVAWLIVMLNPNMLYMQSTAMTELPLYFGMAASAFTFAKLMKDTSNLTWIFWNGLVNFSMALVRYEAWIVVVAQLGVYGLVVFIQHMKSVDSRQAFWKQLAAVKGHVVMWSMLSLAGIIGWLAWNMTIFGTPFEFQAGEYAKPSNWVAGTEASVGSAYNALQTYLWGIWHTVGPISLVGLVALFAYPFAIRKNFLRGLAPVIPQLVDALEALNYPDHLHEVLIVLEEKDKSTQQAISALSLPSNFQVVVRPSGGIMTKPAALNYLFEAGYVAEDSAITVVFDAEDQPDVNQLRKAVLAFWHSWEKNPDVVCVQARLAFSQNATENWLTRMLNLDYTQHFGLILPGLSSLGFISPLGGTSNYILTNVIRDLLWDPFNVTEDMDLAVRMARLGMGVRVFNSVTAEEAVNNARDFVNQRSRWIKGGIQTYLRHMRNLIQLLKELGFERFMSFQFGIGAPLLLNLVNPIFWGMTVLYAFTQAQFISELYPSLVFYAASAMFVAGNFVYVYMIMVAAFRTKQYGSVVYGLMVPIYWVLLSVAAFKATKEFLIPSQAHKWAKTEHKAKGVKA